MNGMIMDVVRVFTTRLALWLIIVVNTKKDRKLAEDLHLLAGTYATRPTEPWTPPSHWACWADDDGGR